MEYNKYGGSEYNYGNSSDRYCVRSPVKSFRDLRKAWSRVFGDEKNNSRK